MLDIQDKRRSNRLHEEIQQDEFLLKSNIAKSPAIAKTIQKRIEQKRNELADIYEFGGDYR
jgi:hypothetical protein